MLGIIGEYVGRILRETRKWPIYLIAETEADIAAAAVSTVRETSALRAAAGP